ncbi:MAG: hypothetical protein ABI557_05140 [Aureliella sp.]
MQRAPKLLLIASLFAIFANWQIDLSVAEEAVTLQSYTVTVVELHLKEGVDSSLSPASISKDFEKLAAAGSLYLVETVSLTLVEKHQTNVQFGKTVAVTMGVTNSQFGKTRNSTQIPLGTSVKATAEPLGDKVLLKLDYQASRITGEVNEDETPDVEQIQIDTSILLKLGQRVTVAGNSREDSKFLLVSVTQ